MLVTTVMTAQEQARTAEVDRNQPDSDGRGGRSRVFPGRPRRSRTVCTVLRWIGYDVPADYGMTIRQATGIPVAPHVGTSYSAMRKALANLPAGCKAF